MKVTKHFTQHLKILSTQKNHSAFSDIFEMSRLTVAANQKHLIIILLCFSVAGFAYFQMLLNRIFARFYIPNEFRYLSELI